MKCSESCSGVDCSKNARPHNPNIAKGTLETTSPKLGMPIKLLWSANMWYDCGCGIRGKKRSTTNIAIVRTNKTLKPTFREINLLSLPGDFWKSAHNRACLCLLSRIIVKVLRVPTQQLNPAHTKSKEYRRLSGCDRIV